MAVLEDHQVLKLSVETKSGVLLGRVVGFELEAETQSVLRWRVRPKGLAARMLKQPLVVSREQVVSIDATTMIVDDNVEQAMELAKAKEIGLVSSVKA